MLSIYSNFGESFERDGNREFIQFVSISKGSVGELRAQLLYALDLGYLKQEEFDQLSELAKEAGRYLGGLIRHLRHSPFGGRKFNQNDPVHPPSSCAQGSSSSKPGTSNLEPGT